jgi:hypothetical protein
VEDLVKTTNRAVKPFIFRFIETKPRMLLELTNETDETLRSIEILTVFLKEEECPSGVGSRSHIRFDAIKAMRPNEAAVLSHTTWVNGKPAEADCDQLDRLTVKEGVTNPYVLHISWRDAEGKSQFQRIPVGH